MFGILNLNLAIMKKITLLLFMLLTVSFGFAQDTCGTAVALPTTAGTTNTNTTINQGSGGGELGTPTPRDAAWFSFSPTIDGTIDVSSCGNPTSDTRLFIAEGVCGSLSSNVLFSSNLAADEDQCGLNEEALGIIVIAGNTYYIEWDDRWQSSTSVPFDWSFIYTPAPCPPTDAIVDYLSDTYIEFSWDLPAFGTPVGYNWEVVPSGAGQGNSVVTSGSTGVSPRSDSATGLTASTNYDLYLQTDCGPVDGLSTYFGPLAFTTTAVSSALNDICSGAFTATLETGIANEASAAAIAGTIENAIQTQDNSDCFGGGNPDDDVWFSFTALTTSVNITVDVPQGVSFDPVITFYSGTCASLTQIACADALTNNGSETISQASLTMGNTYYFRVYQQNGNTPANQTFTYKLWSSETLSINQFEEENTFKYFPNPVTNELHIKAQNNIQNVSVYNMLGQEVLRSAPNTITNDVNMASLQAGTYFVKITINNVTETVKVLKR
jgi:flavin-binding protein dodecin